jgi:hypothetical protein
MPAWNAPDSQAPPNHHLDALLPVQLLEQRPDSWAHVLCANGWSTWVDGRRLGPLDRQADAAASAAPSQLAPSLAAAGPYALAGAALVLLATFLPWLSSGPASFSAWRLPLRLLVFNSAGDTQPRTGVVLLPMVLVALPLLTGRRLPHWALLVLTAVATNTALFALVRAVKPQPQPDPGVGAALALAGGVLMTVEFWRRTWPPVRAWAAERSLQAGRAV